LKYKKQQYGFAQKGGTYMKNKTPFAIAIAVAAMFLGGAVLFVAAAPAVAADVNDAQGIVEKARITFDDFMHDSNFTWFHDHIKNAKGLLIFPQILKGGYIVGGSGGTGVLVLRDEKSCNWSEPAFYTVGSVTIGLQIGGEAAEVIMMVMSQKAVDSLLASSLKLGGDASVALGPIGEGAKANITADFISFAKTKGLYAGLNLEGSVVDVRDGLNSAYYGRNVRPVDIIVKKDVSNAGSREFLAALSRETIAPEGTCAL
jgi:SH3 domain-containing YSC84-like protein 1